MVDVLMVLEQVLGSPQKSSKEEFLFHCPFCGHRKKKLSVNLGKRMGMWKCWVCNKAGKKLISLLYAAHAPLEYINKLRELDPEYISFHTEDTISNTQVTLPIEYKPLYVPIQNSTYRNALAYILRRNFSVHDILRYNIGYCDAGPYMNRVIIPSYDAYQQLNYFIARAIYNDPFKYKNPAVSKNLVIFENMINWKLPVILVEGIFDAMTIKCNAIPMLGKFASQKLLERLVEQKPPSVYIFLDDDAQEDAMDLYYTLTEYNLSVKNVVPTNKDANEMGVQKVWEQINTAKSVSFKELISHKLYA